jgi:hypothetical protein
VAISDFIDVDFTHERQYVPGYSASYRSQARRPYAARAFGDTFAVLSREARRAAYEDRKANKLSLAWLISRVLNQGNEGSCVGNMGAQALEVLQAGMVGLDRVVGISASSIYKQIGSSPNSGSSVEDCIDRMHDTGALPRDTAENKARFKHTQPDTGFRVPFASGWKETAALFSGLEGVWCDHPDEMLTALALGMPVGVGRDGHSILYIEDIYEGSDDFVDYVNSWGPWGFGKAEFASGFGRDSRRTFLKSADWCYAFQAADPSRWNWLKFGEVAA